jgi:DNA-binding MarR family transcriptional regulator
MVSTSPRAEALRPRLIYLMNHVNMIVRKMLDTRLAPHGLNGLQYTILTLVRDREGISSAELSRRFFVTPQTMNESVAGLERRGLIERRENSANRRVLGTRVTAAGRALLRTCDRIADAVEAEVFGVLGPGARSELHALLRGRLRELAARDEDAGAAP